MVATMRAVESIVFTRAGSRRRTAWENLDVSNMEPQRINASHRYDMSSNSLWGWLLPPELPSQDELPRKCEPRREGPVRR